VQRASESQVSSCPSSQVQSLSLERPSLKTLSETETQEAMVDIKATFETKLAAIRSEAEDALSQTTDGPDTDTDIQDAEDTQGTLLASTSPAFPASAASNPPSGATSPVGASDDAGERTGGEVREKGEETEVSSSGSSTLNKPEVASAAQEGGGKLPGDTNREMGKEGGVEKKVARSFMDKFADIEDKLSQTKRLPDANSDLARFRREVPPAPVVVPREHLVIAHGRHLTNPPA